MSGLWRTVRILVWVALAGCGVAGCGAEESWQPAGQVDYPVMDGQVGAAAVRGATGPARFERLGEVRRVTLESQGGQDNAAALSLYWRGTGWDRSGDVVYFASSDAAVSFDAAAGARFFELQEGQTLVQVDAAKLFVHTASGPEPGVARFSGETEHVAVRFIACDECSGGTGRTIVEVAAWGTDVFGDGRAVTASFLLAP